MQNGKIGVSRANQLDADGKLPVPAKACRNGGDRRNGLAGSQGDLHPTVAGINAVPGELVGPVPVDVEGGRLHDQMTEQASKRHLSSERLTLQVP